MGRYRASSIVFDAFGGLFFWSSEHYSFRVGPQVNEIFLKRYKMTKEELVLEEELELERSKSFSYEPRHACHLSRGQHLNPHKA